MWITSKIMLNFFKKSKIQCDTSYINKEAVHTSILYVIERQIYTHTYKYI